MTQRSKRLRDLKRSPREARRYREIIQTHGWVPFVLCDTHGCYWDGFTAIDSNGKLQNGLSDVARKQMTNMLLDGCFGEDLMDAFLDHLRHEKIRDSLIEFPNQEVIARERLRVLDVKRA